MFIYSSVIAPDEEQSFLSKPRDKLLSALVEMFRGKLSRDMSKQVSRQVRRAQERSGIPAPDIAEDIIRNLDFSAWMPLVPSAKAALATSSREASVRSLWKLGVDERGTEGRLAKRFAERWAAVRAAELIGMKLVDGQLVPNPDARLAITDSTRDMVRSLVVTAVRQEWPDDRLAEEMRRINAFSPERAERIARTEMTMASNKGQMIAFKTSGLVTGVRWVTRHDDKVEEHCRANEAAGIIEIGDKFPSGSFHPPDHPNCRCRLGAVLGG